MSGITQTPLSSNAQNSKFFWEKKNHLARVSFWEIFLANIFNLVRVSIAMMNHHDQNAGWGGNGLFGLYFHISAHH